MGQQCSSLKKGEGFWKSLTFMELEPFYSYFVFTKTQNPSDEKCNHRSLDNIHPEK